MTHNMETLAMAAHEVDGVSPDIASISYKLQRGQLTLFDGLVTGNSDDE